MFKNYWKIALRQLSRQGFYSVVKIGGFALGIATCLLIALYIQNQTSFDRDFPGANRVFRVTGAYNNKGKIEKGGHWQAPMAAAIKKEFPQVVATARVMAGTLFTGAGSNQLRPIESEQDTYEETFAYADSSLLPMFGIAMIYGDPAKALKEPYSIVLSKTKAEKYYPGQNPVGRLIYVNDDKKHPWTIGGVMADPSNHTHLKYDFYLSLSGHELWQGEQTTWMASNYMVYVQLRDDANAPQLSKDLDLITKKYWVASMGDGRSADAARLMDNLHYVLEPVKDIHLNTDFRDGYEHTDGKYIWLFGAIAAFILALASINFINLSTARSANRAKEVGVRKVAGSDKSALIRQFLLESMVTSLFSFLIAFGIAVALLPLFNKIAGTDIRIPWSSWWLAPGLLFAAAAIGLLAGLYPAFYLSAFKPVQVLKGNVSRGARHSGLRNGLVVFQFATSVVLIIATMVVFAQMHYILNSKLGFDKDQVLMIQGTGTIDQRLPDFKKDLQQLPGVQAVTVSDFLPINDGKRNMNTFFQLGREKLDPGVGAQVWGADVDYIKVMGIRMAEGRNFSPVLTTDTQCVIINKAMAKSMGLEHPVGAHLRRWGNEDLTVIGVVEDFNYESVKQSIGPLCLMLSRWSTVVAVRTHTADIKGLLAGTEKIWKTYSPQQTLRYAFLDESFARMYADVRQTGNIFTSLSTLAVIIAVLGLLALASFMAEQRRKEMGIRKVLGATVGQVAVLLSRDFLLLVGLAILIGSPIAWWWMNSWLQDYVYRMQIGPGIFIGAASLVMAIALGTVGIQAIKTGTASPAGALRSE